MTDPSDLPDRLSELHERLARERIELELHCGGELGYTMVGSLDQRHLDTIAVGPSGASWILLEPPNEGPDEELHLAADELRGRGFGVVLAHPERSASLMADEAAGLRRRAEPGLGAPGQRLVARRRLRPRRRANRDLARGQRRGHRAGIRCARRRPEPGAERGAGTSELGADPKRARMLTEALPRALIERGMPSRLTALSDLRGYMPYKAGRHPPRVALIAAVSARPSSCA